MMGQRDNPQAKGLRAGALMQGRGLGRAASVRGAGETWVAGALALALLAGCDGGAALDWDLRNNASSTASAVERATLARPAPDANGVISYPNYQVVVARRGDTVAALAARVGLSGAQLGAYNGLNPDNPLRPGEVLALPVRVAATDVGTTATPGAGTGGAGTGGLDISTIATSALDRVDGSPGGTTAQIPFARETSGPVPVRYQVRRGETAFTIARQFDISARALADWNGLGPDLAVREGQYLIIPTAADTARLPAVADATPPGQGSPLPEPPSSSQPLPDEATVPVADAGKGLPASPDLSTQRTASSAAQFAMPVAGSIARGYQKGVNDGIDITATSGAPVKAAAAGVVAAVTKDTSGNPILVLKHTGGLLTVYTGIGEISVAQGATVTRGQTIAKAAGGTLHFEVRQGVESVDPLPYLQ